MIPFFVLKTPFQRFGSRLDEGKEQEKEFEVSNFLT